MRFRRAPAVWILPTLPTLLLLALSTMSHTPAIAASALRVNEPFPDLALPALDGGKPLSISDFRGKKVVLHVFASW